MSRRKARCYQNPYVDERRHSETLDQIASQCLKEARHWLAQVHSTIVHRDAPDYKIRRDHSVYTGSAGQAFAFLHMYKCEVALAKGQLDKEGQKRADQWFSAFQQYLSASQQRVARDRHDTTITFMCGRQATLVLSALHAQITLQRHVTALCTQNRGSGDVRLDSKGRDLCARRDACLHEAAEVFREGSKDRKGREYPDELLYGRVGYIWGLLYVCRELGVLASAPDILTPPIHLHDVLGMLIPKDGSVGKTVASLCEIPSTLRRTLLEQIDKTSSAVIRNGQALGGECGVPLMYEWHESLYLGGAHGLTGICHVLWDVPRTWETSSKPTSAHPSSQFDTLGHTGDGPVVVRSSGGGGSEQLTEPVSSTERSHGESKSTQMQGTQPDSVRGQQLRTLLFAAVHYCAGKRLESGNYPTRHDSDSDRLVHFCHGATAFAVLFARTVQAARWELAQCEEEGKLDGTMKKKLQARVARYERLLAQVSDVVWERGLLTKGFGVCHGVTGNAYVFLLCFRVLGDRRYYLRACAFVSIIFQLWSQLLFAPDRPLSLMEGCAGVMMLVYELVRGGKQAHFPTVGL